MSRTTATLAAAVPAAAALHLGPALLKPASERALRRRCREQGVLSLTYDDGPGPVLTPRILDVLAAHGARATFFVLGARAREAPEVLDRARLEGHEIGVHGHDHLDAWRSSPAAAARDLRHGYHALARWAGRRAPFRPPHGHLVGAQMALLAAQGASPAFWTVDGGDTHPEPPAFDDIVGAVDAGGGGVVLLHDFDRDPPEPARDEHVLGVTDELLSLATRRGWRAIPFGDLTR